MSKTNEQTSSKISDEKSFLGDRFEFKYILDSVTAIRIEKYIRSIGMTPDTYSKGKPYLVNSLYFDTPTLSDYRDKDGSFLIRKKLRARSYIQKWSDEPENIWLEIKKKRNMNISKSRVHVTRDIWNLLYNNKKIPIDDLLLSDKDNKALKEFVYLFKRHLYGPHVIIKYGRTAYMSDFMSPVRITFDANVVACRADTANGEKMMIPVTKNKVIMEVKYTHKLPWWFSKMITHFDIQRDDFSKYRNSVAMLRGYNRIQINK